MILMLAEAPLTEISPITRKSKAPGRVSEGFAQNVLTILPRGLHP